ncbi:hypothetical protein ACFH04_05680 [Streptomyces noboritoensis]|uniref:Uncharacterized protein n=1 Tax=Streptomyces noboritoensis TaxID=67337 RepID=A0ABV6TBQ3_9ACTN
MWTGHPSARPALVDWLRRLAGDGRPLVRTRAAATAAVLARADLPSAMALVIEPWATSSGFRHRQVTVNALVLAHLLGLANVSRIIDSWCVSDDWKLSWVAIRAHGLIGPERPLETLVALRGAARRQQDQDEPQELLLAELAESVELLILSPPTTRSSPTWSARSTTTAPSSTSRSGASSAPAGEPGRASRTDLHWSWTGTHERFKSEARRPGTSPSCGGPRSGTPTTPSRRSKCCAAGC